MSWQQLADIAAQNRADREFWRAQPPRSCPNDGTPLVELADGREGELGCPFDGWIYPRDWNPDTMAGM